MLNNSESGNFMKKVILGVVVLMLINTFIALFAQSREWEQTEQDKKDKQKKAKEILGDNSLRENSVEDRELQLRLSAEIALIEGYSSWCVEEYENALEKFRRAVKINPKSSGLHYQIAQTLLLLKKYNEAIEYALKAISLENNNLYYYLLLVQIYTEQGMYQEAARTYEDMFARKIAGTDIYWKDLAELYHKKLQNPDKALKIYEELERKYGIAEHINYAKQEIFLEQKRLAEALKEAEKLAKFYDEKPQWQANYAKLLIESGKALQAEEFLRDKIRNDYTFQTHLQLLYAYRQQNKTNLQNTLINELLKNNFLPDEVYAEILKNFVAKNHKDAEEILKINPKNVESWLLIAQDAEKKQDFAKAREAYKEAVKLENTRFEAWQKLLFYDYRLYEMDELMHHAQEATELYPTHPEMWWYYGKACFERKNYKKAIECYETGKTFTKNNSFWQVKLQTAIAELYLWEGKIQESEKVVLSLKDNQTEHQDFMSFYAYWLAYKKEKLEEAFKIAQKLIELDEQNGEYLYTLAFVQYRQGKLPDALATLEKALAYRQGAKLQELMGDIYFKMGKKNEAIQHWQKANELKGGSTLLSKKLNDKQLYE